MLRWRQIVRVCQRFRNEIAGAFLGKEELSRADFSASCDRLPARSETKTMLENAHTGYQLASAVQRFVGDVTVLEPTAFRQALRRLLGSAPTLDGVAASVSLWHSLTAAAQRGAASHHQLFHRFYDGDGGTCSMTHSWPPAPLAFDSEAMRETLLTWGTQFSLTLEKSHEWPVAVRAAGLLQQHPLADWYMSRLAREVATSVATLERSFKEIYASTPAQYQSLIRVRATAGMLRSDEGSTEGVIISAGWRSLKDFTRTLRRVTGWRAASLRHCSVDEFNALMSGPLTVPMPNRNRWSKAP